MLTRRELFFTARIFASLKLLRPSYFDRSVCPTAKYSMNSISGCREFTLSATFITPPFELTAEVIAVLHELFSNVTAFEVSFTGPKRFPGLHIFRRSQIGCSVA